MKHKGLCGRQGKRENYDVMQGVGPTTTDQ